MITERTRAPHRRRHIRPKSMLVSGKRALETMYTVQTVYYEKVHELGS